MSHPSAGLWPIDLANRLTESPAPTAADNQPAKLDLQSLFQQVFDEGGSGGELYAQPSLPPLNADQLKWVEGTTAS